MAHGCLRLRCWIALKLSQTLFPWKGNAKPGKQSVKKIPVVILLCAILAGCEPSPGVVDSHGKITAPDMKLAYIGGTESTLSDLKGQVVLLNFWATWCPPCREELPHFEALHKAYKDRGLAVIGVSMDQAENAYVQKFSDDVGITYPIAMSRFEEVEKIWSKIESIPTVQGFGPETPSPSNGSVRMMPTTFVIDRSGKIYRKHVGPRDRTALEPELRMLMGFEEAKPMNS